MYKRNMRVQGVEVVIEGELVCRVSVAISVYPGFRNRKPIYHEQIRQLLDIPLGFI